MGLPQLEKWVKTLNGNQKSYLKTLTKDAILCLEAFLLFIAKNPQMLSTVLTFIQGLKALIDAQISLLQLLILQMDIENQIINALLQPYRAFKTQLNGLLSQLPFKEFERCPPIKLITDSIANGFNSATSNITPFKQMKNINEWIKRKEFELARRRSIAQKLAAKIEQLRAIGTMLDALVEAIQAQFAVLLQLQP